MSTNTNTEKKETKLSFDPVPMDFPGLITTMYCDTSQIARLVNNSLRPIFPEVYGAKVEPSQSNRVLDISVIFINNKNIVLGDKQYKVMEEILSEENIRNNLNARLKYFNNIRTANTNQRTYKLKEQAKQILSDLVPSYAIERNGKVNWKAITQEFNIRQYNNSDKIGLSVQLDFNKLLRKIYGYKNEDGSLWNYLAFIGSPINPQMGYNGTFVANKWQVFILRCKDRDVIDLANRYGLDTSMGYNRMGIITD